MREGRPIVLIAVTSGLLSVMLAVAVNVATGGTLPGPLSGVSWLAWPAVALLGAITVALAILQQPSTRKPTVPVPRELPAAVTTFAGKADLAAVNRVLADGCRVLAVSGPPGAGKSTLALHVAHERRDQFPDGELFATLRGAEPDPDPVAPEEVLTRFLERLGVPADERRGGLDDLAARYRSAIADRRMLIVLDNARNAAQVLPLLPGGPGCLVLITSRPIIASLPHAVSHPLGGLDDADARELFTRAASDARAEADPDGVSRIIELCGGLPLAVRIAAARLKARPAWTPSDLADRLADERRRLKELEHEDLAVRSSFEASYGELSDVDRAVFRRAGSHPGRVFGPAAAAALAQLDEATTSASLERLVDMHLVESPAPDRYRLHDLLRLFAQGRLSDEEREYTPTSYLDWLAANAATEERDNVVAGVRHAVAVGAYEAAWTIVDTVHPLLTDSADHPDRLALWREGAVAAAALGDEARHARALRWVSSAYRNAGEVTRALEPAAEAVAIAGRLGDRAAEAEALTVYGECLRDLSRFDEARSALERALDLFVELGDVDEEVEARVALGTLFNTMWQPELAAPVLERARELMLSRTGPPSTVDTARAGHGLPVHRPAGRGCHAQRTGTRTGTGWQRPLRVRPAAGRASRSASRAGSRFHRTLDQRGSLPAEEPCRQGTGGQRVAHHHDQVERGREGAGPGVLHRLRRRAQRGEVADPAEAVRHDRAGGPHSGEEEHREVHEHADPGGCLRARRDRRDQQAHGEHRGRAEHQRDQEAQHLLGQVDAEHGRADRHRQHHRDERADAVDQELRAEQLDRADRRGGEPAQHAPLPVCRHIGRQHAHARRADRHREHDRHVDVDRAQAVEVVGHLAKAGDREAEQEQQHRGKRDAHDETHRVSHEQLGLHNGQSGDCGGHGVKPRSRGR